MKLSRPWPWIALGAAVLVAAIAVTIVAREAGDQDVVAALPPPPPCEPGAADLNRGDRRIEPSRGERLIARQRERLPAGFNDSSYQRGYLTFEQALALYDFAGVGLARLPLDWGAVESSPGELDFGRYDEIYCEMLAAGVRPVWHLTGIPGWAAPLGFCREPCVRPPEAEHLPQLARFAEIAAIRYPRSAAVEAWNEPNLSTFWYGDDPDPATYLPILRAIYTGTKNGNPAIPVLGGALSNNPTDEPGGDRISLRTYLAAILAGGAADYMDGLAIHAYPVNPLGERGEQFTPALTASRELLAPVAPEMRIWITEIGMPTEPGTLPAVAPDVQAEVLAEVYLALERSQDIDAVLFHSLVDAEAGSGGGAGFGFFSRPDDSGAVTVKPVACAIRALLGQPRPCPASLAPAAG